MDKGTDKNMWLIFYTLFNLSYLMFVPNFKILGPEKSLTEKKLTHKRKKQKLYYIPTIYFVYRGYN